MTNNKALFLKWIKNLFYVECIAFAIYLIAQLPFAGSLFDGWPSIIVRGLAIYCLYNLIPVHERYQKAFMFSAITLVLNLVVTIAEISVLSLVGTVTGIIALYQEYSAHSEILVTIDKKLADKWHSLFNWNVFGVVIVVIVGAPVLAIATVVFLLDETIMLILAALLVLGIDSILNIFYLLFLKRTHDVCEKYEYWVDDTASTDC